MTVYIEYVIIENFIIDYLLMKCTYLLTGKKVKRIRVLLTALLGAFFALLFPLVKINAIITTTIKLLFGAIMVLISAKYLSFRDVFINVSVLYGLSFAVGGVITGLYNLIGISANSDLVIAITFIPIYVIIFAIKKLTQFLFRRRNIERYLYDFQITVDGQTLCGRGFLDTGNGLYDSGVPVIISSKKFILPLLKNPLTLRRIKKLNFSTAGGESCKSCIHLDEIKIFILDKPNIFNNVGLLIADVNVTGADAILHPALLEVNDVKNYSRKVKEVS